MKTEMSKLASAALDAQSERNLRRVVYTLLETTMHLERAGHSPDAHPVVVLLVDRIVELAGMQHAPDDATLLCWTEKYATVNAMAKEGDA